MRDVLGHAHRENGSTGRTHHLHRLAVLNTARIGIHRVHPDIVRIDPVQFLLIAVDRVRPRPRFRAQHAERESLAGLDMRHPFRNGRNLSEPERIWVLAKPRSSRFRSCRTVL